jgi:tellurite resistance protein TerC
MNSIGEWWMWVAFFSFIVAMLAMDMFLLGRKTAHPVKTKEALSWVLVWFSLAMIFNFLLWRYLAHVKGPLIAQQKALEFLTGYIIEKSLSVDNMFVFVMFFNYFAVPSPSQRKVLLYGVSGAILMRLLMILLGVVIVSRFHWVLYIFGIFLVFTGIKMFIMADKKPNLERNRALIWIRKHLRITEEYHRERFFIYKNKLWYITPLFLVLILIEISDLIFALDSIPAIFAITEDPFIIFTSNIFAILGLRALYFLLANMIERFHYLKYGLAIVLIFIGGKMLIVPWYKMSIGLTIGIVMLTLTISVVYSLFHPVKLSK